MRVIGLDIHRAFAEAMAWGQQAQAAGVGRHAARSAGRIRRKLSPSD